MKDSKHLQTQMRINLGLLDLHTPEGSTTYAPYQIDVSRRPKTIDIVSKGEALSTGKFKGRKITVKAIYLLEGDRLTICSNTSDTEARPTEFKTQPDDGLTLEVYERAPPEQPPPVRPIFIKPGESKTVTLGDPGKDGGPLSGGKDAVGLQWENFKQEFTLTFADTDVPKGVTFEPAKPVVKKPGEVPKFTIRAAQDAALGDFAIAVTANFKDGGTHYRLVRPDQREQASLPPAIRMLLGAYYPELHLSVDPAGEAAREQQPGKPRRRYRRLSADLFIAHDGKLLSIADRKLIMKSKDGTEHSYTLADKFASDQGAWHISYNNSGSTVEGLKGLLTDPATPVIIRVTAKKAKPQEPTHIEAVNSYDGFTPDEERQRQKKERQEIEREKQEIERQKKVQQEIDHLQGTWLVVSSRTGDKKEPLESLKKQRVTIQGDHLTLAFGNERNEKREGTIKIDPQKKSLDWVIPMAGDAAMQAIYELKGDDLKIGFGVEGVLRPTRFEMSKDEVGWLLVLKRPFPEKAPAQKKAGQVFKVPGSGTLDVALTADGKILARAGVDQVDLWDVAAGKKLHTLKGYTAPIFKVAFSPDGKTLASIAGGWGPDDCPGEVKLWDVATGKERVAVKGHPSRVWSLAFSADGKTLATSSKTVKLWDVATGKEKMEFPVAYTALAFAPDGKTLAVLLVGGDEKKPGSVQLWDLTTGKKRVSLPANELGIGSLGFTPDGKTLVSAGLREAKEGEEGPNRNTKAAGSLEGYFCQLKLWDVATAKERATIPISGNFSIPFFPLVFTADSRTVMTARWISDQEGKKVRVTVQHWDLATGKEVATFWTPVNPGGNHRAAGHVAGIRFAALSADGKIVAWGGAEGKEEPLTGTAHVWEVESLATSPPETPKEPEEKKKEAAEQKKDIDEQLSLTGPTSWLWSVSVSADGKRVLTSVGTTLRLWDADTGKSLRVFEGHTGGVLGAALSPDGKRVLSGGADKIVRLWNADTGKELRKMTGHTDPVSSVAFGPEGQALSGAKTTPGGDGTMRLWDLNTGKQAAVFSVDSYEVLVAYSAKARLAATCTWTDIRLWDLETRKEVRKLTGHTNSVVSVCFSPDGMRLVSASLDGTVRIWDVKSGQELKQIPAYKPLTDIGGASCAAFSPDGKRVVSGGDGGARVWDAESGKLMHKYEGDTGVAVAFFPDGKRIASATKDGTARIWLVPEMPKEGEAAPAKKQAGQVFKAPGSGTLGVALSPDGKFLARAGTGEKTGQTVDLWDVASGKRLHTLKGPSNMGVNMGTPLSKVAFSPDGKTLATVQGDMVVKLWEVATGKERAPLLGHRSRVYSLAFSADGKTLATSHSAIKAAAPAVVRLWDLATGKEKMELGVDVRSKEELERGVAPPCPHALAFSPDGNTLAISVGGSWEKPSSLQLWDVTTGKRRASMPGNESLDWSVGFTPDGKTLISAGFGINKGLPQLTLWDVATARERATILTSDKFTPQGGHAAPLVFTADGKTLITTALIFESSESSQLRVQHWDLATGKARATYWTRVNPGGSGGNGLGSGSALSADGKTVACGAADGHNDTYFEGENYIGRGTTAHVWEVGSLATSPPEEPKEAAIENKLYPELILRGHGSSVWRVCVSADGKRLVTCSGDRTLKLWDTHTGECLQIFEGHTDRALCAALSPDGKRMLSGGEDLTVRLWDATTGKELLKMTGHTAKLYRVAFLPEDQALSQGQGDAVRLWDLNTGKNIGIFAYHTDLLRSVAHGDKEKLAATTSRDTSIGLRDVETGKVVRTIPNLGNEFHNVGFSADGKHLLSAAPSAGSADENNVRISDAETGQELFRIHAPNAGLVAFSPDGKRIVTGMPLRVWDLATGRPLRTYEGHGDGVTGVRFFPDSRRIVSTSYDGSAHIWRAPELKDLKQLTSLNLGGTRVTDADLKEELKDLKHLTSLNLEGTRVTDAGLAELADLKQLTSLNLSDTKVTDAGMKELKHLKHLTTLKPGKVTDAGLAELKDLKQLTSLTLGGARVTDVGLKEQPFQHA